MAEALGTPPVDAAESGGALPKSQAARRQRVIAAALELSSEGGYDAVQMRDVATRASVALGTIYRYFSSKDALLAAAMEQWMATLEERVLARPPAGRRTPERVMDVLKRALHAIEREPQLTRAVVTALTSGDPAGVEALTGMTATLARIMRPAFPPDVDSATEASVAKMLGHIWWSTLIAWAAGMGDMRWVSAELTEAAELLAAGFD
jgi:TetR/AcrR family transcriptional regulator, cholesterol catabolism regulator